MGKLFKAILCVFTISTLYYATLGCQTTSDCIVQTTTDERKSCCHYVVPSMCMDSYKCNFKQTSRISSSTGPFAYKFNKFTTDYSRQDSEPRNNNCSNNNTNGCSSSFSFGIVGLICVSASLGILITCLKNRRNQEQPPTWTTTRHTNVDVQGYEQTNENVEIVILRRDGESRSSQNYLPNGEPPFLTEEEIRHNSLNVSIQEPPQYEENLTTRAEHHPPRYDDIISSNDQPPYPGCDARQVMSTSESINPTEIAPEVQQYLPISDANPPSYEEAQQEAAKGWLKK